MPRLVIAAGGTGGHMFPAQALAEVMLADGWDVTLSTDPRGARYAGGFPDAVRREVVSAGTFGRAGLRSKLLAPFQIGAGVLKAIAAFRRNRPDVVVGFGGYPAFPAMTAAWVLGLPRMIHEQNGVLGRVNAVFAKRVDKVACAVWPTELPEGVPAVHTGNPVRQVIRDVAGTDYVAPTGPINLLVIGGSQGASILSRVVPDAVAQLPHEIKARLTVAHQARDADHDAAVTAYREAGITADVSPFFDDVARRLVEAQLVVSRSGASSVADIAAVGRPSILIPLAIAIRDEQTANARGLEQAGAAVVMPENTLDGASLCVHMSAILGDPDKARAMAQAAAGTGRPDAVDLLKSEILKLTEKP